MHISSAVKKIDTRRAELEREIELVREYRTRLVADVVTGKLDVRGARLDAALDTLPLLDEGDDGLDEGDDGLDGDEPEAFEEPDDA